MISSLVTMNAAPEDKATLEKALQFLKKQSIRASYLAKISSLIDTPTAKEFDGLYQKRSGYVHDGKGRGQIGASFDRSLDIATKLLVAELAGVVQTNGV